MAMAAQEAQEMRDREAAVAAGLVLTEPSTPPEGTAADVVDGLSKALERLQFMLDRPECDKGASGPVGEGDVDMGDEVPSDKAPPAKKVLRQPRGKIGTSCLMPSSGVRQIPGGLQCSLQRPSARPPKRPGPHERHRGTEGLADQDRLCGQDQPKPGASHMPEIQLHGHSKDALRRKGVPQEMVDPISWHSFRVFIPDCWGFLGTVVSTWGTGSLKAQRMFMSGRSATWWWTSGTRWRCGSPT